jgi:hypothetical protein
MRLHFTDRENGPSAWCQNAGNSGDAHHLPALLRVLGDSATCAASRSRSWKPTAERVYVSSHPHLLKARSLGLGFERQGRSRIWTATATRAACRRGSVLTD